MKQQIFIDSVVSVIF